MQAGETNRTYTQTTEKWYVRGYSKVSKCYVYPYRTFSWDRWDRYYRDTYDSFADALRGHRSGYLGHMIEKQQVVDIEFFQVVTQRQIVEQVVTKAYTADGGHSAITPPHFSWAGLQLRLDDYLMADFSEDRRANPGLYCQVTTLHEGKPCLTVINGGWKLFLDSQEDGRLIVDPQTDIDHINGKELIIFAIGPPDPLLPADDWEGQYDAYYEKNAT